MSTYFINIPEFGQNLSPYGKLASFLEGRGFSTDGIGEVREG